MTQVLTKTHQATIFFTVHLTENVILCKKRIVMTLFLQIQYYLKKM